MGGGVPQRVMQAAVHTNDIHRETANAIHAGGILEFMAEKKPRDGPH